jgi:hypothetical protein
MRLRKRQKIEWREESELLLLSKNNLMSSIIKKLL